MTDKADEVVITQASQKSTFLAITHEVLLWVHVKRGAIGMLEIIYPDSSM
jgi:hypothetical protein